jgi:hypothetical protein
MSDWGVSWHRLALELDCKFAYLDVLPWKIFGIANMNTALAREAARRSFTLFANMSSAEQRGLHPMARRFLDPSWAGLEDHFGDSCTSFLSEVDPALVLEVESFVQGTPLHQLSDALCGWLGWVC